ncbi:beta-carotene 15,15'-monooxygenase [Curtobacterium sp. SGAir0471]|uniref:Brp/Blh family beta-carotene 15,15'-dioxygenase n=1 Tax=Curtobacterium sp. SGAir0471 TaxID=2070337 RepID=UPI0010CD4793|nr:Brp/Blh family beta-carotene 15,15'-dioxygenase [Curtobacterium sp. SGAir0471]QCR44853.1 beta-carotene 15,15'-monooxygenase [Curtobacterium sp. SGAir0471]
MSAVTAGLPVLARPEEAPPALRTWVADHVLAPVTAVLVVVALVCAVLRLTGTPVPTAVQLVPFAVSVLVFGLPHGALDHLVPARLRLGTSTARSVLVVVALYLVVGSATAALWVAAPLLGFAVFVGITWFHWGQGDLFVDRLLGDGAPGRAGSVLTVLVRGALPMLVPFVAQPGAAVQVVVESASVVDGGLGSAVLVVPTAVRIAGAVLVAVLVVLHAVVVGRSGGPRWRQVSEDLVLVAFFTVVPPVLAVGLYFTLWHAVRHILRLELTDPTSARQLHRGRLLAPFLRFARQAWPITAVAIVVLVVLAVVVHRLDLGVYLALIAALTTPHTVVVTWMDHVQRTWTANPPAPRASSPRTKDTP